MTIDEARAKAHQEYDHCMFCPSCSKLLTGLHMDSLCYTNWIDRAAQQILKDIEEKTWQEEEPSHHWDKDSLSHGNSQKQTQGICAE